MQRKVFSLKRIAPLLISLGILMMLFVLSTMNEANHGFSEDRQKRVDLKNIKQMIVADYALSNQNVLESFQSGCVDIKVLEQTLENISAFADKKYTIGLSDSRLEFVLRAEIEKGQDYTRILEKSDDVDGVVFGCQCDDPYYCFKTNLKEIDI